jgi:hypothetical protein
MSAREPLAAKAARYLAEGRLVVLQVDGDSIAAECRGSGEVYRLGHSPSRKGGWWWCSCPRQGPMLPPGRAPTRHRRPEASVKFCTVCGEWFDPTLTVLHCARPKAVPLPTAPTLPHGDFGTVWPVPEHIEAARAAYWREPRGPRKPRAHPAYTYSEDLPETPGYFVYRLWADTGCSLYVGMVGLTGPRLLSTRLGEHKRDKPWWPQVAHIDATECDPLDVAKEEALQIARFAPEHNLRTEGGRLTPDGARRQERREIRGEWNQRRALAYMELRKVTAVDLEHGATEGTAS